MKVRIIFKSFNNKILEFIIKKFQSNLKSKLEIVSGVISLPTSIKKFCVLRSPHVDKDSREEFEIRIYKKFIDIDLESRESLNNLLNIELPAGIHCSLKIINK